MAVAKFAILLAFVHSTLMLTMCTEQTAADSEWCLHRAVRGKIHWVCCIVHLYYVGKNMASNEVQAGRLDGFPMS